MAPYTIFVPHPSNLLTDHRPTGDGLLAWAFLERLAARGHRLHVACQRIDVAAPLPPSMRLYRLSQAPKLRVAERLRYMARLRRLYDALARRERIDLVHQLNPVDAGVSLALPRDAPPVVLGPYVPPWPEQSGGGLARALGDRVRARQQRRARLVLLSSPAARTRVPRPLDGTRVAVLPPGIEGARFAAPARRGDRPPTVLFLANLQARKGIFTLLDAFERAAGRVPGARLVIAGGGPDAQRARERIAASPAAAAIDVLGPVAREQVAGVLAGADVYCLPSFGEPFGISALEAMAAGLPLVTTSAGGLAHLAPPDGGIQVAPGDAGALADALTALLGDPARRAAMGDANRRAVASTYEWDGVIDRLEALYAEAVSG